MDDWSGFVRRTTGSRRALHVRKEITGNFANGSRFGYFSCARYSPADAKRREIFRQLAGSVGRSFAPFDASKDLSAGLADRHNARYSSLVIEQRDIVVWSISAVLAVGMGMSRYAKAKSRRDLVRQLAAMDVETRRKTLSRLHPEVAMEVRQQLLERFRIMC